MPSNTHIWIIGLSLSFFVHLSFIMPFLPKIDMITNVGQTASFPPTHGNAPQSFKIGALSMRSMPPVQSQSSFQKPIKSVRETLQPVQDFKYKEISKPSLKKNLKPVLQKKLNKPKSQKVTPKKTQPIKSLKSTQKQPPKYSKTKQNEENQVKGNTSNKTQKAGQIQNKSLSSVNKSVSAQSDKQQTSYGQQALQNYQGLIQKIIHTRPKRRQRKFGKTLISFTLNADGSLQKISVLKSSGLQRLDKVALSYIQSSNPFPPFPAEINKTNWTFTMPIHFQK